MQVFKLFFKILKSRMSAALIYIIVFCAVGIMMAVNASDNNEFKETELTIRVIDQDNTPASQGLTEYIKSVHKLSDIDTDKDALLDNLFARNVSYVLTIKEGYEDKISSGETDNLFSNYKISGSYSGELFESQLNQYVANVSSYIAGGFSINEAVEKTAGLYKNEVTVNTADFSKGNSDYNEQIRYFFQYLSYILICVLIFTLCPVLLTINSKDLRRRINCSCISMSSQTVQIALATGIFVLFLWLFFMIVGNIVYKNMIFTTREGLLAMLNSFVFLLISFSIAMLVSAFSPSANATSMIANVIGLGMSFLCGVFVPQEFLPDSVIMVSRFLPVYWYVRINEIILGISEEAFTFKKYFAYLGIEFLFFAALMALVFLIARTKQRSSES